MSDPNFPAAMIEAGARALAKHSHVNNEDRWDQPTMIESLAESIRDKWRDDARAVLFGAVSEAQVRIEWGYRYRLSGRDWTRIAWCFDEREARTSAMDLNNSPSDRTGIETQVVTRLVITTDAEIHDEQ